MPTDGARLLAGYQRLDAAMVASGRRATSPAWAETLSRFWLSGRRRLVVRKGRQGGGSTTMARVAVASALFGERRVEPGMRLVYPFVSITMREARERLRNIADVLTVLGEPFAQREDAIELRSHPAVFQVYPCSARFAVGMTAGDLVEDEVARWWSEDVRANPAVEVDAALVPALVTQPNARIYTISSPLGTDDFHAELMARGETADQCVAEGPSWYWNPSISEESSHGLQADPIRWRREFLAIPQGSSIGALDPDDVRAMVRELTPGSEAQGAPIGVLDASSGAHDAWVMALVQTVTEPTSERPYLLETDPERCQRARVLGVVEPIKYERGEPVANPAYDPTPRVRFNVFDWTSLEGEFRARVPYDRVIAGFAKVAQWGQASSLYGDEHLAFANEAAFGAHGLRFTGLRTSPESLAESAAMLRQLSRDRAIAMRPCAETERAVQELCALQEVILPSGRVTLRSRRTATGHGDRASVVLLLARLIASADGSVPGAPRRSGGPPIEYDASDFESTLG